MEEAETVFEWAFPACSLAEGGAFKEIPCAQSAVGERFWRRLPVPAALKDLFSLCVGPVVLGGSSTASFEAREGAAAAGSSSVWLAAQKRCGCGSVLSGPHWPSGCSFFRGWEGLVMGFTQLLFGFFLGFGVLNSSVPICSGLGQLRQLLLWGIRRRRLCR